MLAKDGALPGQNYLWLDRMESFDFTQAGIYGKIARKS
jgi:hypothetical protein